MNDSHSCRALPPHRATPPSGCPPPNYYLLPLTFLPRVLFSFRTNRRGCLRYTGETPRTACAALLPRGVRATV